MKRLLNYPGSKWSMAELIIGLMPKHKSYLEPFFGSGAVFFNKDKVVLETVNDIDGRLVNCFRMMRDQPEKLQYLVMHTLYSREEFYLSQTPAEDPVEDARRMLVRLWFGVGGKTIAMPGFRKNISWNGPYTAYEWTDMYSRIGQASMRLKGAQIETMDATKLLTQTNDKDTLIYCDPPYVKSKLVSEHYANDFTDQQHEDLLNALLQHKGPVLVSGYMSDLYADALSEWYTVKKDTKVGITSEKKSDREEIVWCNFEPPGQIGLF